MSLGVFLLTYPFFYFIRLFERLLYRLQTPYYAYYATFWKVNCLILPISYQHLRSHAMYVFKNQAKEMAGHSSAYLLYCSQYYSFKLIGTRNPLDFKCILFAFCLLLLCGSKQKGKNGLGLKKVSDFP